MAQIAMTHVIELKDDGLATAKITNLISSCVKVAVSRFPEY